MISVIICKSESVVYNSKIMLPTFSQYITFQEAFETTAQMNKELKRMEFDGVFCKKFILLVE